MARVVLHVGTHKTGSTALQHCFAANRKQLARHGIFYPEVTRGDTAHHGLAALWHHELAGYEPRGGSEAAWHALARKYRDAEGTLVLSSEEFSRAFDPDAMDYEAIRGFLADFERIDLICLLRDQLSFLQSAWVQVAKVSRPDMQRRHLVPWSTFVQRALRTGRATGLALDYNLLLDRLEAAFGAEHVAVLSYAEAAGRADGTIGLVLRELGFRVKLDGPTGSTIQANVTDDPLSVWAAAQVSAPLRPEEALVALARDVVSRHVGGSTTLYSAAEAKAVRERFEEPNERLVRRLEGRRPGFSLPWMSVETAARRGRLGREGWIEIARRLHARPRG